eukprot:sb/3472231/
MATLGYSLKIYLKSPGNQSFVAGPRAILHGLLCSLSLSFSLSLFLSLSLTLTLSLFFSPSLSLYLSFSLPLSNSIYKHQQNLYQFALVFVYKEDGCKSLSFSIPVYLSLSLSLSISLYLSISPFLSPDIYSAFTALFCFRGTFGTCMGQAHHDSCPVMCILVERNRYRL